MKSNLKNTKILVVDDEPVIREMLCAIFREDGYDVMSAEFGKEAIALAKKNDFDAAIIDIKLPDVDGMQVLSNLRKFNPEICVILITAYPSTDSAIKAIEADAYEYIIKPFDIGHVKLVMKRGIRSKKLVSENKKLLLNLEKEKQKLEIILNIGQVLNGILDLEKLSNVIVRQIADVFNADVCSLMFVDKQRDFLTVKAATGLSHAVIKTAKVKIGDSISGWVAEQGEAVLVQNIENDLLFGRNNLPKYKTKSLLCTPLKINNNVLGVINVTDKSRAGKKNFFTNDDLNLLTVTCNYAAIAIENARLYSKVSNLAVTDGLTNLYNQRYLRLRLGLEVMRVRRYHNSLSLVMFDLDYFKRFNDNYGHQAGDKVLFAVAEAIKQNIRNVDIACRYGGEEFVVILPETKLKDAVFVADKIRNTVYSLDFSGGENCVKSKISISGGCAEFRLDMTEDELIMYADKALYKAKHKGKNRICVYSNAIGL